MQIFKTGIYDLLKTLWENRDEFDLDKPWKQFAKGKYDDLLLEEQILNQKK